MPYTEGCIGSDYNSVDNFYRVGYRYYDGGEFNDAINTCLNTAGGASASSGNQAAYSAHLKPTSSSTASTTTSK